MNVRTKARQRAKQIIFNRKCAAESKALSFCDKAFSEHPDLLKLQKEKNELRGRLLEATLSDGNCDDLKAKLDDVQSKINKLLKDYYKSSDAARPHYMCDKCSDTGVFAIGGKGEISEVRQTAERSGFGSRASEVALNINSLYTVDIEKST